MTEEELAGMRNGDPAVWSAVFGVFRSRLLGYCRYLLDGATDRSVEPYDVYQEAWEKASGGLPSFAGPASHLSPCQ